MTYVCTVSCSRGCCSCVCCSFCGSICFLLAVVGIQNQWSNKHCTEWTPNTKRRQSPLPNICGQYCIAFIIVHCHDFSMKSFVDAFSTDCSVFDWLKQFR